VIGHDIGRKPDTAAWVGVDVGGTKILAGVVAVDGSVVEVVHAETPSRSDAPHVVEDTIVRAVQRLGVRHSVAGVGVGAAGFVGLDGVVRFAPHVSWRDEPLQQRLTDRLGLPVRVDNDANTTALAELTVGAARGVREALCITLGTGIGGAVVMGGEVRRGFQGLAGEFGHMQVVPDGEPCPCGQRGCWEQYSSGTALRRAALAHGAPDGTAGPQVTAAARSGDDWALRAFDDVGTWLGVGVAGLCSAVDPEVVVIGGGLSAAGELLLEPARRALVAKLPGREHRTMPRLVGAGCGPEAGMVGAAELARRAPAG
jgi:glucokinase